MRYFPVGLRCLAALTLVGVGVQTLPPGYAASPSAPEKMPERPTGSGSGFLDEPQKVQSSGVVTINNNRIAYDAIAGTLIVHAKGWDDAAETEGDAGRKNPARTSMFYVAYFKKGVSLENRPIMFLYNGGPGSSTVWLHMGAFGPRRVITADDTHTLAAPYKIVNNTFSLLDVADLVFIDAPGTGYSRLMGKDKDKAFLGTDPDAAAFTAFIAQFLSRYGRYNSPKYLFGESYGTTRSAIVANMLADDKGVDLNGVILLSQVLNYDNSVDDPQGNPSNDQPYVLALPSYAATAWYHKRLPSQPSDLKSFLREVEHFALTDYASALQDGNQISSETLDRVAEQIHRYTGISVDYIKRADLRISGGEFEKELLRGAGAVTGRLDSRYSGPTMDRLGQFAEYDPQSSSVSSAYVSAFNDYAHSILHYGNNKNFNDGYQEYKVFSGAIDKWDFTHQQPNAGNGKIVNVLPDLASAMKHNPNLRVMLNQGYYDIGTTYFQGVYEMRHLNLPPSLTKNIEIVQYESGHMIYAHEESLRQLHDNVARFILSPHSSLSISGNQN